MSEPVITALIGLAGSAIGSIAGIIATSRVLQYRIEQLEKKVDKHNNLIERTYKLEERAELTEEKLKVANHRISDLENERK